MFEGESVGLQAAKKMLPSQVEVLVIPQDDAWFRDSGPSVRPDPASPGILQV
jgi:agmatine/peptidylarginine deiminase